MLSPALVPLSAPALADPAMCKAQVSFIYLPLLTYLSLTLPMSIHAFLVTFSNLCDVLQGRCAAVLMFHTQLALLPAMETEGLELDLMMDDPYGEGVEGPGGASTELVSATVGNSYVVNLAKMGIKKVQMPVTGSAYTIHNAVSVSALLADNSIEIVPT